MPLSLYSDRLFLLPGSEAEMAVPDPAVENADTTTQGDVITVTALLFYAGKHSGADGKAINYAPSRIKEIAAATNKWMESRRVKLYNSTLDHGISQAATIGFLSSPVVTAVIDAGSYPGGQPPAELMGKLGIFGKMTIAGSENIAQYRDGRLRELSVGIATTGEIVEVSAVSIPALSYAALFTAGLGVALEDPSKEFTPDQIADLIQRLTALLPPTPIEEKTMDAQSLDNLAADAANPEKVQKITDELVRQWNEPDPDKDTRVLELEAKFALQTQQLTLFNRRSQASDRFSALKARASALLNEGKFTPAAFAKEFETRSLPNLATFSAATAPALEAELATLETECDRLSGILDYLEANAVAIQFGMLPAGNPEPEADPAAQRFMASYVPPRAY